MENWQNTEMDSSLSSAGADELVSVKRSILDIVVVQQQKRIMELEDKLRKSKQEILCLQREKAMKTEERQGGEGQEVPSSEMDQVVVHPLQPHPPSQQAQAPQPQQQSPRTPIAQTTSPALAARAASTSVTPKLSPSTVQLSPPKTVNVCTPKLPHHRSSTNSNADRKSKSVPIRSPNFHILPRYWTEEEHHRFLEGRKIYGPKNYAAISAMVGTRTPKQVRTHAQKYEMRLVRESAMRSYMGSRQMFQHQGNAVVPTSNSLDGNKPLPQSHPQFPMQPPHPLPQQQVQQPPAMTETQMEDEDILLNRDMDASNEDNDSDDILDRELGDDDFAVEMEKQMDMQVVPEIHAADTIDDIDSFIADGFETDVKVEAIEV